MSQDRHPDLRDHSSPAKTREAAYERLREVGVPRDNARKAAEESARQTHEIANRRGR